MRLTEAPLELDALIADSLDPRSGALVVFGGTVRNHHEGRGVTRLNYSGYAPLADRLIREIERETVTKFSVHHCRVVHRTGELGIGEVAIYAVVRAAHRREAFAAAQYAVDAVKHRVPVWKEEFYADGSSAFVQGCCIANGVIPSEARDLVLDEIPRRSAPRDDTQEAA
jgi:molybdopterin synthase catalytic subunit